MVDVYLSSVSNKMNSIIKVLTMISTIFIGMNFKKNFPEIDSEYGYPGVWSVMILITGGMILYFRKKKWL
jgi:magnesium transporter